MEDNPFSLLLAGIQTEAKKQVPTFIRLGEVITSSPLTVNVAQTIQDKKSLLKNDLITEFNAGDTLLLIPIEEEQRYIIICKVVNT